MILAIWDDIGTFLCYNPTYLTNTYIYVYNTYRVQPEEVRMDANEIARFFDIAVKADPQDVAQLSRLGMLMIDEPSSGTFSFAEESKDIITAALSGKNNDSYGRILREDAEFLMRKCAG